jgi:hypothetical protein
MITFYIVGLSTKILRNDLFVDSTVSIIEKMTVMMRNITEEKTGQKGVMVFSYYSSFEGLFCK